MVVLEVVRSSGIAADLAEQVVHEREQPWDGAEAARDRSAARGAGPQRVDEAARFLQHRDLGVAEAVDGLLAIADDEDRRLRRDAEAFAPGLHQEGDQLPLLAAGVLELVDEHVVVPALEAVAALR